MHTSHVLPMTLCRSCRQTRQSSTCGTKRRPTICSYPGDMPRQIAHHQKDALSVEPRFLSQGSCHCVFGTSVLLLLGVIFVAKWRMETKKETGGWATSSEQSASSDRYSSHAAMLPCCQGLRRSRSQKTMRLLRTSCCSPTNKTGTKTRNP